MIEKEAKPEDYFEWGRRDSIIKDTSNKTIYKSLGLEAPVFWSDDAVKIAGSKFFYNGDNKDNPIEKSVKQLVHRVANSITNQAVKQGVIKEENKNKYYSDLASLCYGQSMLFNSPVWFNVWLNEQYGVTEGNDLANSSHWE